MTETPAQFTRRLMEKYKDVIDRLTAEGLDKDQQLVDKFISAYAGIKPLENTKEQQVLKDLNKQINAFIKNIT